MPQCALGLGVGQGEGPGCGAGIVVFLGQGYGRFAAGGHTRGERHPGHPSRRQPNALPQAEDGVEQDARRAGEGAAVEGLGIPRAAAPTQEDGPVALPFHGPLRPALQAHDVHGPDVGFVRGPGTPPGQESGALRQVFRLDEELAEGRVGQVVGRRGQDDLDVARDLDFAGAVADVGHGQPPHLDVVLGRDGDVELGPDVFVAALEGGLLRQEGGHVFLGLLVDRMISGRPDRSAPHVTQVDELAARIAGGVRAVAGHGPAPAEAGPAAGVRHDGDVVAVGQELGVGEARVRRAEAADGRGGDGRRHPRLLGRPGLKDGRPAGHALLQQQLGGLHPQIGMEALHHAVAEEGVGQSDDGHALVMGQERADDDAVRGGRARRGLFGPVVGIVDGFVIAVGPFQPGAGEQPQVAGGPGRVEHGRQRGRVRGHHELVAQAPFQAQPGNAEGLVLVIVMPVHEVIGRLRDAPGQPALPAVLGLPAHGHAAGLVEKRLGKAAHEEKRHQVFEHGRAPRQQSGNSVDAGGEPPQVEPMRLGQVALGDGDEAGQARFGGQ